MANEQSKKDLLESLVDIRDVKIDRSKPVEERMKSYARLSRGRSRNLQKHISSAPRIQMEL